MDSCNPKGGWPGLLRRNEGAGRQAGSLPLVSPGKPNKEKKPCLIEPVSPKQEDGQNALDTQMLFTSLCGKLKQGCLDRENPELPVHQASH